MIRGLEYLPYKDRLIAWRREDSEKTSLQHSSPSGELINKREMTFSTGR